MQSLTKAGNSLDVRKQQDLLQAFENADTIINKNYLRILMAA